MQPSPVDLASSPARVRRTALVAITSLISAVVMAACQPAVAPANARAAAEVPAPPPVTAGLN